MQPYRVWVFSDLIEKNKRVFKVPVYQRNYDWSNIQCEKLYQDIMKANERDHKHFMGTVVYIVGLDGSNLNEALIIDGQQRITTVYILLKALYDAAKGVSVRIETEIEEVMFNRNCDEKYKLKLKPVKSDNEQLLLLIKDKIDEMDRNSNIYKNYITFKNLIENTLSSGLELNDILDSFVGEYVKVLSWVDLLAKFINIAYDLDAETFNDLAAKDYSIPYADRIYISNDERKLHKARQIDNSGIFYETNLSSNNIISFIKDLLLRMKLEIDDFNFSLSEAPFDVNDENTWIEEVRCMCE